MSTKMATGMGGGQDGRQAAAAAVAQARSTFGEDQPDLVILYCSSNYNYAEVLETVRQQTGRAPLVGASTAGEFTESDVRLGSIAVSLIRSDQIRFFTGLAEDVDHDPETAVANIISQVPLEVPDFPHRCIFLLTDGMVGNGEEITLMVANMSGSTATLVGGLAADDFKMQRTVVFHNDRVTDKAASICVMASQKPFYTSVNHGHCPLSKPMRITKARGNVLYEVEGRPAWDVWKEATAAPARALGIDVDAIRKSGEVAGYFSNFELGLRTGEDSYKVRYPMSINPDGSVNFTCTIPNGAVMCIMDGRDEGCQIEASRTAAERARAAAVADGHTAFAGALVIECAVRQFLLGDNFPSAPQAIREVLGNVPMIGAELYGEMRLEPGEFSGYHNTTTVVLLLVE
ncbi:MAG: FIST C-terminal domain-containing protein [Verrucomicrobiales bacterium]|nr:FIST C-terminal domain-containing protein [Verrucomicrobiales bacterium]